VNEPPREGQGDEKMKMRINWKMMTVYIVLAVIITLMANGVVATVFGWSPSSWQGCTFVTVSWIGFAIYMAKQFKF
jgi:hypothetical protein